MHKRDQPEADRLAKRIKWHCEQAALTEPSLLKEDGTPNHNRIAEDIQDKTGRKFSQSTLTRLLNAKVANPSIDTLRTLATYFHTSVAELRDDAGQDEAVREIAVGQGWPFRFKQSRWDQLLPAQRKEIEKEVARMVRLCEAGNPSSPQKGGPSGKGRSAAKTQQRRAAR